MKRWLPLLMLLLFVSSVSALDFTPNANINMRGFNITNASYVCLSADCRSTWPTGSGGGGGSFDLWRLQVVGEGINSITNNSLVRLNAVGASWSNDTSKNFTLTVSQGFNQSAAVADLQSANSTLNLSISNILSSLSSLVNLTLSQVVANVGNWSSDRVSYLNTTNPLWTGNVTVINNLVTENASLWSNASVQQRQINSMPNLSLANINTNMGNWSQNRGVYLNTTNSLWTTNISNFNTSIGNLNTKAANLESANVTLNAKVTALNTSIGNGSITRVFPLTSSFRLISGLNITRIDCVNDTSNNVNCTINAIDTNSGGTVSIFYINGTASNNQTSMTNSSILYFKNGPSINATVAGSGSNTNVTFTLSGPICNTVTEKLLLQADGTFTCGADAGAGGGMTSWTLSNGSTTETITDGERVNITCGRNCTISQTTSQLVINAVDTDTNSGGNMSYFFLNNSNNQTQVSNGTKIIFRSGAATFVVVQNDTTNVNVTYDHADTSTQASVDNSGSTFIQDVTLDTYGHITAVTSAVSPDTNCSATGSCTNVLYAGSANFSVGNSTFSTPEVLTTKTLRLLPGRNISSITVDNDSTSVNITIHAIDTTSAGGATNQLPAANISAGVFGSAIGSNNLYTFPNNLTVNGTFTAGINASAFGEHANAIGRNAGAGGVGAFAAGDRANASADGSIAIGQETIANRTHNIAIGYQAQASGNFDVIAIGTGAVSDANDGIAIGTTSEEVSINGQGIAIGNGAKTESSSSVAIGQNALVDNIFWPDIDIDHGIAVGADSISRGQSSTAIGPYAEAVGNQSTAIGYSARTRFDNSVALGESAITTTDHQFVIGASTDNLNTKVFGEINSTSVIYQNNIAVCLSNGANCTAAANSGGNMSLFYLNNTNNQTQVMNTSKIRWLNGAATFVVIQNDSLNTNITIDHADTSSQASSDNSARTYIQDVILDTYGHVTSLVTAAETVTDTDTNCSALGSCVHVVYNNTNFNNISVSDINVTGNATKLNLQLAPDVVGDSELNTSQVTLTDFTNDANFITDGNTLWDNAYAFITQWRIGVSSGNNTPVTNNTLINLTNSTGLDITQVGTGPVNITFKVKLSAFTTTDLTEGTNPYFTDSRAALAVQNTTILRNATTVNVTKLYVNTSTTANLQANSSCTLVFSPGGGSRLEVCD